MLVLPRHRHTPTRDRSVWRRMLSVAPSFRRSRQAPAAPPAVRRIRWIVAAVMLLTLVPGDRGLYRLVGLLRGRAEVRAEIAGLQARRTALEADLRRVTTDPATIERLAREQLDMVRRGETVYKFIPGR